MLNTYVLVAQAADPTSALLQYGAIGVIAGLALLAVRVLYNRLTQNADAERQRADRLEAELRETNKNIQERHLTTLAEVTKVLSQVIDELREDRR